MVKTVGGMGKKRMSTQMNDFSDEMDEDNREHFPEEPPTYFDPTAPDGGGADEWSWDNVGIEEDAQEPEFCFLCTYSSTGDNAPDMCETIAELEKMAVSSNHTGALVLQRQIRAAYDTVLRPRVEGSPEWTDSSIRGHLDGAHGTCSAALMKCKAQSFLGQLAAVTRNHLFKRRRGGDRKVEPNLPVLKLYLNIQDRIMALDENKKV
jgi:hypothetical protein